MRRIYIEFSETAFFKGILASAFSRIESLDLVESHKYCETLVGT